MFEFKNLLPARHEPIGIWGFGKVGQSVVKILLEHGYTTITILTEQPDQAHALIKDFPSITILKQTPDSIKTFLSQQAVIIPSPGVDIRPYYDQAHAWCSELDLFAALWHKPIIAITGSAGKTSVTHIIHHLINKMGTSYALGGNIGNAALNLVQQQESVNGIVLEVSSFQLEYTRYFKPSIALLLNIFENHLDRHGSMHDYIHAKSQIFAHQTLNDIAITPIDYTNLVPENHAHIISIDTTSPTTHNNTIASLHTITYDQHKNIIMQKDTPTTLLINYENIPTLSYPDNWLAISAVLQIVNYNFKNIAHDLRDILLPEHRLTIIAEHNNVKFYDDSKATLPASTMAALNYLAPARIHLLIGGTSKGVDRKPFIANLPNHVIHLILFGAEAQDLAQATRLNLPIDICSTLPEAFEKTITRVKSGDIVLFSPAGASFDLFADYKERGNQFIKLVHEYAR